MGQPHCVWAPRGHRGNGAEVKDSNCDPPTQHLPLQALLLRRFLARTLSEAKGFWSSSLTFSVLISGAYPSSTVCWSPASQALPPLSCSLAFWWVSSQCGSTGESLEERKHSVKPLTCVLCGSQLLLVGCCLSVSLSVCLSFPLSLSLFFL